MTDIYTIPEEELRDDRAASVEDAKMCEKALALGIETYSGGESVRDRLAGNLAIIDKIDEELNRRKAAYSLIGGNPL